MNQNETNKVVRVWLNTLPGTIQDGRPDNVMRRAWGQFGHGNLEMFRAALAAHGFKPESLGAVFILRLPSKPTGNANWTRIARMTNRAG